MKTATDCGFYDTCHSWLQHKFLRARCGPRNLHPTHAGLVLACLCEEKSSYLVHKTPLWEESPDLATNRKRMISQAAHSSALLLILCCCASSPPHCQGNPFPLANAALMMKLFVWNIPVLSENLGLVAFFWLPCPGGWWFKPPPAFVSGRSARHLQLAIW